jgi:hypothetical protein
VVWAESVDGCGGTCDLRFLLFCFVFFGICTLVLVWLFFNSLQHSETVHEDLGIHLHYLSSCY